MNRPASRLAALLFGSGACALVYQIGWLRELRLVFGASTAAAAAVLALFTLGLCAGGVVLGRRADRHPNPVGMYAMLEIGIAASAALSPTLVGLVRRAYIAIGGTVALGALGGTIVRLILTALVLAVPTFLMGGTLPAAARGVQTDDDVGRRRVGLLYGINTLGAVTGCLVANFWLLERVGTRATLYAASVVNIVIGLLAWQLARADAVPPIEAASVAEKPTSADRFVLAAAAIAGFAFFVMELVWYRMLGPILGGTVFTFGLILAVALFGIGIGGAGWGIAERRHVPSLRSFAITSLLEALCMAIPYALGDRVATLALLLRPLSLFGFAGLVSGWALVALIVVLPAAMVAGFQFPLLIALLGRGRSGVGRQTGLAYAWNTAGAIAGSLGGGFVLIPAIGAPGCWRAVAYLLAALGLTAALAAPRARLRQLWAPLVLAAIVALVLRAPGPSAVWRHSPIGVGRVPTEATATLNAWREWTSAERRGILWETDGRESTVALSRRAGLAFVINGKVDGHVRADAPTQVMSGMVGAILHPDPKSALVIGLGTGSSAGWLGAIPEIDHVDVVELEPAIERVARDCASVNRDVMNNPKVRVVIGDAREVLLVTRESYDLIFSEPSNPYRAGIASLFTREYYQAAIERLRPGGVFLQWVQAYDVDSRTVRRIYATLGSVFPSVQTWELGINDLLLVASAEPIAIDAARLRAKIEREPYKAALAATWRANDLEGMMAHFVAGPTLARAIADQESLLNTDDRTLIEFAFARAATRKGRFDGAEVLATARARREDHPAVAGEIAWDRVEDARITFRTAEGERPAPSPLLNLAQRARAAAQAHYLGGNWQAVIDTWRSQGREPSDPTEIAILAETLAERGDPTASAYAEKLRALSPAEADATIARLFARQGKLDDAMDMLEKAFAKYRTDPWPWPTIMRHAVELAADLAMQEPRLAERAYRALRDPFAGHLMNEMRTDAMLVAAGRLPLESACAEALAPLEPNVPWRLSVLSWRKRCYEATAHRLARRAAEDVDAYLAGEAVPFGLGLTDVELE
jgi:spermidine synthase